MKTTEERAMIGRAMAVCVAGWMVAAGAFAQDVPANVSSVCQSCHGPGGNSATGDIPRLNGQQADYIVARLKDFRYPGSQDPHATAAMWGVVEATDNASFEAIARYYAAQTPSAPASPGPRAAGGKSLFLRGDVAAHIPACGICHGAQGEGSGAIPRLAGQHGAYLTHQLERLRLDLRSSDTMHPRLMNITDAQIAALVAWLARD
jgi:cytochrome c553